MENLLIIFIKNPVLGKVKSRLAVTVGEDKALEIYRILLRHTYSVTRSVAVNKALYYSDYIEEDDMWEELNFKKHLQHTGNLGERMQKAFEEGFAQGYQRICIIGSDCYEITADIIRNAFDKLQINDVVLGPTEDGGYYLLGMRQLYTSLIENKRWSTNTVLSDTLTDISDQNLTVALLPTLTDIDEEKDLKSISFSVFGS